MLDYSAGFTSEGWFEKELETVLQLKLNGYNRNESLEYVLENNAFQMRSENALRKRFRMVFRRSEFLDEQMAKFYIDGNIFDRRALLIYSFFQSYRLPYEFFTEVVLHHFQLRRTLQRSDFDYFFEKKELVSDKVKNFRPETKKKLIQSMFLFFRKSGLFQETDNDTYSISPLHLSSGLKRYAKGSENKLLLLLANLK